MVLPEHQENWAVRQAFWAGVDACGEGGEYHTLVVDGPIFKKRLGIIESNIILKDEYGFLNITDYEIKDGGK